MASEQIEEKAVGKRNGIASALLLVAFGALIIWIAYRASTATERDNLESAKALLHDPYSAVFSNVRTSGKAPAPCQREEPDGSLHRRRNVFRFGWRRPNR